MCVTAQAHGNCPTQITHTSASLINMLLLLSVTPLLSLVTFIAFWVEINCGGTDCEHRLYPGETQKEREVKKRGCEKERGVYECVKEQGNNKSAGDVQYGRNESIIYERGRGGRQKGEREEINDGDLRRWTDDRKRVEENGAIT